MGIKKTVLHNEYVADDEKLPGRKVSLPIGKSATDYIIREGFGGKTVSLAAGYDGDSTINLTFKIPNMTPNKKYNLSCIYVPYVSTSDPNTNQFISTQGNCFYLEPSSTTLNNIVADVNGRVQTQGILNYYAKNATSGTVIVATGYRYFCLLSEVD